MRASEPDDSNGTINGDDDPNLVHLFLKENSKRKPLVIMQINAQRNNIKANIYIGEDDEPNELALLFVSSLGLPMELKETICEQIAKRKVAIQAKRSKRINSRRNGSFTSNLNSARSDDSSRIATVESARDRRNGSMSMHMPSGRRDELIPENSNRIESQGLELEASDATRIAKGWLQEPILEHIAESTGADGHTSADAGELSQDQDFHSTQDLPQEKPNNDLPQEPIASGLDQENHSTDRADDPVVHDTPTVSSVVAEVVVESTSIIDVTSEESILPLKLEDLSETVVNAEEGDNYDAEWEENDISVAENVEVKRVTDMEVPMTRLPVEDNIFNSPEEVNPVPESVDFVRVDDKVESQPPVLNVPGEDTYENEFESIDNFEPEDGYATRFDDDANSLGNMSIESMAEAVNVSANPSFANAKYSCFNFRSISSGLRKSDFIGCDFVSPLRDRRYDLEWRRQQHMKKPVGDENVSDLEDEFTEDSDEGEVNIDGNAEIYSPSSSMKRTSHDSSRGNTYRAPLTGDLSDRSQLSRGVSPARGISRQTSNSSDVSTSPQLRSKAAAKDIELTQQREEEERRRVTILTKHAQRSTKEYNSDSFIGTNFHWAESNAKDGLLSHKCPVAADTPQSKCPVCSGLNRVSKLNWKSIYEMNLSVPVPLIGQVKPSTKPAVLASLIQHPKSTVSISDIPLEERERERRKTDTSWGGLTVHSKHGRSTAVQAHRFDESGEIVHDANNDHAVTLPHNHIAIRPSYHPATAPALLPHINSNRRLSFTAPKEELSILGNDINVHPGSPSLSHEFVHSPMGAHNLRHSNNLHASGRVRWHDSSLQDSMLETSRHEYRPIIPLPVPTNKTKIQVQFDTSFYGTPTVQTIVETTSEVHVHPISSNSSVHSNSHSTSDDRSKSSLVVGRAGRLPLLLGSRRQILS